MIASIASQSLGLIREYPQRILPGKQCYYCSADINPGVQADGATRHFDHFTPRHVLTILRRRYPKVIIDNVLIPACPRCNGVAGCNVFTTLIERAQYVSDRLSAQPKLKGEIRDISIDAQLIPLIRPEWEYALGDYIIAMPVRRTSIPLPETHPAYRDFIKWPYLAMSNPKWVIAECCIAKPVNDDVGKLCADDLY